MATREHGIPTVPTRAASPDATRRNAAVRLLLAFAQDRSGQVLFAALVYLGYAIFLTWPLVLHMHSQVFGASGNDQFSFLAFVRELSQHGNTPFTPTTLHSFAAPEGLANDW